MSISGNYRELFEMANRGGLTELTKICFSFTALAVQCYTAIASDERLFQKFLCFGNQRSAFISGVRAMTNSTSVFCDLLNIKCSFQYSNFDLIIQGVFNCCAKNSLKRINSRQCLKNHQKRCCALFKNFPPNLPNKFIFSIFVIVSVQNFVLTSHLRLILCLTNKFKFMLIWAVWKHVQMNSFVMYKKNFFFVPTLVHPKTKWAIP